MIIYIVELHDCFTHESVGYFEDSEQVRICCEYMNKIRPSKQPNKKWVVKSYASNIINYKVLNDDLEARMRNE